MNASTFQTATQSTDLDRFDNIRATVDAASVTDADTAALVAASQAGDQEATLELIARSEAYLRSIVSDFRVGNGAAEPDLQQAAMLGFLAALKDFDPAGDAAFHTFAYSRIRREMTETNRTASPVPVASSSHKRFFAAMRAADNDPAVARRWTQLQKLSIAELEALTEDDGEGNPDAALAREIVDRRTDIYEAHVARGYVTVGRGKGTRGEVPAWEEYRNQPGRGLSGHEFDTILSAVTYSSLDAPGGGDDEGDDEPREAVAVVVTADPEADPFADVENRVALAQVVTALDERERDIVTRHLGGETDRDIATALGVSRPRVVNIRAAAIKRMKRLAQG